MNLDERQLLLISTVVVVVVLALLGTGIFLSHRSLGERQTENAALQKRLDELRDKIQKIPALEAKRDKLRLELAELERILPDEKELENMVDTLAEFRKASSVEILSVKPINVSVSRVGVGRPYDEYQYKIEMKSDFYSFAKFANLLETYKRFIRIDSFRVSKKNLDAPENDVDMVISTFSYRGGTLKQSRASTGR